MQDEEQQRDEQETGEGTETYGGDQDAEGTATGGDELAPEEDGSEGEPSVPSEGDEGSEGGEEDGPDASALDEDPAYEPDEPLKAIKGG